MGRWPVSVSSMKAHSCTSLRFLPLTSWSNGDEATQRLLQHGLRLVRVRLRHHPQVRCLGRRPRSGRFGRCRRPGQFTERTEGIIDRLHSLAYVQAVRTGTPSGLAESQGFACDPKLPSMAIAHSSGLVAAVSEVLSSDSGVAGSLSSGLHHARRDRGAGYCTFNGLAVAAAEALGGGAERILVLDFDAHCGGGTRSMTSSDEVVQIDVSTVMFDSWEPTAVEDSLIQSGPDNYVDDIAAALHHASRAGTFDLVLYNAGMDPANSGVSTADLRCGSGWSPSGPPTEDNDSSMRWPAVTPEAVSRWKNW